MNNETYDLRLTKAEIESICLLPGEVGKKAARLLFLIEKDEKERAEGKIYEYRVSHVGGPINLKRFIATAFDGTGLTLTDLLVVIDDIEIIEASEVTHDHWVQPVQKSIKFYRKQPNETK